MWFRRRGFYGGFRFGFPPFMFYFGPRPFPRKEDYLRMLEDYRKDMEAELREVEKEIEELKRE
jgi:hypothetical protein